MDGQHLSHEQSRTPLDDHIAISGERLDSSRQPSPARTEPQTSRLDTPGSTTSLTSPPRLAEPGSPPSRERPRVRFGKDETSEAIHGPVSTAHAKPRKSNFPQSRTASDSAIRGESNGDRQHEANPFSAEFRDATPPIQTSLASSYGLTPPSLNFGVDEPLPKLSTLPRGPLGPVGESTDIGSESLNSHAVRDLAAQSARAKAEKLSSSLNPSRRNSSTPVSRASTPPISPPGSPEYVGQSPVLPKDLTKWIPLDKVERETKNRKFGIDDSDNDSDTEQKASHLRSGLARKLRSAARRVLPTRGSSAPQTALPFSIPKSAFSSGQSTPDRIEQQESGSRTPKYRAGVLGTILNFSIDGSVSPRISLTPNHYAKNIRRSSAGGDIEVGDTRRISSTPSSGRNTPKSKIPKWHERDAASGHSSPSLSSFVNYSTSLGATAAAADIRPALTPRSPSSNGPDGFRKRARAATFTIQMQQAIEDIEERHKYLITMCRALMIYGVPTHRLEELMESSAKALGIKADFLYTPNVMMVAFQDESTRTTQSKMIKTQTRIDLGRLVYVHDICKAVIHGKYPIGEAIEALETLEKAPLRWNVWQRIFMYGVAVASVCVFAFSGRPIDVPVSLGLGWIMGFLDLYAKPRFKGFEPVFEIMAPILSSFLARFFGSVRTSNPFCFSALAQSSIAILLPGFPILGAALDLQAKKVLSGSVRMVHSIVFSLMLGFSMTLGFTIYGAIDSNATSDATCSGAAVSTYWAFLSCTMFTISLGFLNYANLKQLPAMVGVSVTGYTIIRYATERFDSGAQIANAFGAAAIGMLGNLYSRFFHGVSAAVVMPALMIQIPGSLTAQGSLFSSIKAADALVGNTTATNVAGNVSGTDTNSIMFVVSYKLIEFAVGITVGLYFSSWVAYPFRERKKTGLFSF